MSTLAPICTCPTRTICGKTIRWSRDPDCEIHGALDWSAFNDMTGRSLPHDDRDVMRIQNQGDYETRFGRIQ